MTLKQESSVWRSAVGLVAVLLVGAPQGLAGDSVGYRGDRSGVFNDAHPPLTFDEKAGKNVLWKSPLPNWGNSSPVVVKDRVLVTCEGGWTTDLPQLLCYDAGSGKLLWQKELDHLPLAIRDPVELKRVRETWHKLLAFERDKYQYLNAADADPEKADQSFKGRVQGVGDRMSPPDRDAYKSNAKFCKQYGLTLETWHDALTRGLDCVGQSFATPVSDGERVYVATAFGGTFAFDLDGGLAWSQWVQGQPGEYCRNGRSPLIYRDLLISDITATVRAFDRKTGTLVWSSPLDFYHMTVVSPVVITVGGTDVLLCGGKDPGGEAGDSGEPPSDAEALSRAKVQPNWGLHAFRLPDGKPLAVAGWRDAGTCMLVNSDERDVVFFTGGGEHGGWRAKGKGIDHPPPAAVKFALEGETLKGKVLWSGIDGEPVANYEGVVYHGGKLYHSGGKRGGGFILDAATGRVVAVGKGKADRVTPDTMHLLLVADGRVYGLREQGKRGGTAVLGVCSLDGKKLAESSLTSPAGDEDGKAASQHGSRNWGFGHSCAFTISGGRIYVRSNDLLYCLGEQ